MINCSDDTEKAKSRSLYLDFMYLKSKEKKLLEENESLKKRLEIYNLPQVDVDTAVEIEEEVQSEITIKRRKRRTKAEIDRMFACVVEGCDKAYG